MAAHTIGARGYRPPTVTDASSSDNHHQSPQPSLVPYGGSLVVLQDASLRNPIIAARKEIVDSWIENELKDATAGDVETYRHILSSEEEIAKISNVVLSKITQGKRPNTTAIAQEIGRKEIIEFFVEYAFDLCIEKREAPQREAREEIERILDVLKAGGNEYDVLGIDEPIALPDLRQLRRRILYLVHPDKNKDKEAQKCAKEVNRAADKLLSMDQKLYQPPTGSRIFREHKGVFGPGAFATGDTEPDNDEDSDTGDDIVSVPDIPDAVKKVHEKVSKHIQTYFSDFTKGLPVFNDEIRKANNKIRNLNVKAGISGDYYQADRDVLQGLKEAQVRVIRIRETQGAKEAEKQLSVFKGQCEKTCGQRNFQWPGNWSEVMVQAVREKLDEINQSEPPPNKEDGSDAKMTDTEGDEEESNPVINMLDADNVEGIILGYRSSRRYNRFQEQYLTDDITFFIQSPGASIFGVFSLGDLGHEISTKALSYYKDGGNDVSTHIEAVTGSNPSITPATYNGILCICAKKSGKPPEGRFPDTWIQIALKQDSDPSKAKIIHRTALRKLVKDADSQIERFYNEVGVEPPWAYTPYPDPYNQFRPRPLMFPAPRSRHYEYDRHLPKALPFHGNMRSIGYEEAATRRAPQTRSSGAQPQIASGPERLIAAMETLVLAMVEDREDRKRYQDYMESKLLGEG
ncbi:hypothetical protein AU210_014681 [Fusarium oxysporum f. sp. radicis-cucumerinum]|uniref:J domain-containing protein n=1 Tax=Fusarium oxysporum f. sp. radicis-cucumerinum TaxID=327505 RepID=A0A2H3G578_FUSOX|nr:hypothetical protein AU210_014681 [Fusarium oxysporum f. sp. radicis-cucumerinum]